MDDFKITFEPLKKTIKVSAEESILDAAKRSDILINASCGGEGICGRCKIILKKGGYETISTEKLTPEEIEKGYLFACQTYPKGDITIEIPPESRIKKAQKIATLSGARNLYRLLTSTGIECEPIIKKVFLKLPPPNLQDNISDFDRLKRELTTVYGDGRWIDIDIDILTKLSNTLREKGWEVTLNLIELPDSIKIVDIHPGEILKQRFGIAVDIGTTTIVVYIVDLSNGKVIDHTATYNSQVHCGDDVITRIIYATERGGLKELKNLVTADINKLIAKLIHKQHLDPGLIESIVIAGNTTMTHLFYGINPRYIREEPYIPVTNLFPLAKAGRVGIDVNKEAVIYTMPGVASYVGGDITSGVIASGLYNERELSMFIDIGTNGEIVLGNSEWLVTAACSAGPCFEGSGIKSGMRATEGAIEQLEINRKTYEPVLKIIGNTPPSGLCGSGMIDAIAEMFLAGIVDQKGNINKEIHSPRIRKGDNGLEYVIAWGNETDTGIDIVLTEVDIENIMRAKAAIYAGFSTLLKEVGFGFSDIRKFFIGGGFGNYLDIEKAIIIGLLPDIPHEKFIFLGNTSITGAYLCLLCSEMRKRAEEAAKKMTYIELSVSRSFMDEYMSALFLPHTNIDAFPSLKSSRRLSLRF
ncbi:MAG: ASKHA domain-containing protein [Nitrospirota bacterium]